MGDNMEKPFSYHTFILPFAWITDGDYYGKFVSDFEKNKNWVCTDMKDSNDTDSVKNGDTDAERNLLYERYKEYQYFYPYARKAIYGFDEKIVRNFSFMPERLHNKAEYCIKKGDKNYRLDLNAVRLKIYNTGVALFILECENREYRDIEAVKNINDYGRRITLPFIPDEPKNSIIADSLSICIDHEIEFKSDFEGFIKSKPESISMNHIADFIKDLLNFDGRNTFSSHRVEDPNKFRIYPLLGDRMYVMSLVCDKKTVKAAKNDSSPNSIYELAYVDHSGGYSCANDEIRDRLLEESLYKRWIGYGSCYYVTNYSFILLTDGGSQHILESFITQYFQMYCLAIAQRASVTAFKKQIAGISVLFGKKTKSCEEKRYMDGIGDIAEKYIAFESQLVFDEVSPEQQGIEIYDLIKEKLLIQEEVSSLKEQIDGLYNVSNIRSANKSNNQMTALTWIAFIVSIASMVISAFQITGFKVLMAAITKTAAVEELETVSVLEGPIVFVSVIVAIVLSIICLVIAAYKNRKNR